VSERRGMSAQLGRHCRLTEHAITYVVFTGNVARDYHTILDIAGEGTCPAWITPYRRAT